METVAETQLRITQFIQETYPSADIAPGSVLSELLVKLSAAVNNEVYNSISSFSQGGSFKQAQESEEDTYSEIIDNLASNYFVTRNEGSRSTGLIKVVVNSSGSKYLSRGVSFIQPSSGLEYVTTQDWTVRPNPSSTELRLYSQGNGVFYFLLPVTAADVGPQYQVENGTIFTLVTQTDIANFVGATAYGNFSSGKAQETDKELIARIETGMTNRGMTSQMSIQAKLSSLYSNLKAVSVVGAGDPEMVRDKQNQFGIATFGLADVYIRSSNGLDTVTFVKRGQKQAEGVWSFTLDYNDVPGFYDIVSVQPNASGFAGSVSIQSKTWGISYPSNEPVNLINNVSEARYTQYQKCDVVFNYTEAVSSSIGATEEFLVTVSYQPLVRESQLVVNDRTYRLASADYLVKAAVPCFVNVVVTIQGRVGEDVPVEEIKQDIFNYINNLSFGEPIYASKIIDICHNYDEVKRVVTPVTMTGLILAPTGVSTEIVSEDVLSINNDYENGVSDRVVGFFTGYGSENSGISIQVI